MRPGLALAATATAALVVCVACSQRRPIAACTDDLRGTYLEGDRRWMVLDHGATLEAYPLFPDADPPGDVVAAPRAIDLARTAEPRLAGTLHRRYERAAAFCEARAAIHVTSCADDTLTLVLADPVAPLGFSPCTWPRPEPSHVARWRRD